MIKSIGYTADGLVFLQFVSTVDEHAYETTVQFSQENARAIAKYILDAVKKAKQAKEVSN